MTLPTAPRFWRRFRTPMNFPSTHTYAHTKGFFLVGWVSSKRFLGERRRKGRKEGPRREWERERERNGRPVERIWNGGKVGLTYSCTCHKMFPSFDRSTVKRSRAFFLHFFSRTSDYSTALGKCHLQVENKKEEKREGGKGRTFPSRSILFDVTRLFYTTFFRKCWNLK